MMDAAYVFRVEFVLEPAAGSADPDRFETVYRRPAPPPREDGWRFFREALWRGACNDDAYVADLIAEDLGVPVVDAQFSELAVDDAYLRSLREAIAEDLEAFNADSVDETLHKYLGSSIHVYDR